MTKERLEEFREFIDFMYESIDLEDHQRFIAISESMLKDGWFKWIYKLAKEQAERVQEMENEMKRIKIKYRATKESHYSYSEITSQLEQQNKRYREAIEKAIEMISESTGTITTPKEMSLYDAWILKSILLETILEGEE